LRGIAGIDLTGARHKTWLRIGGWIGSARRCDENRAGCRQSDRRGDENAAFHDEPPWLVLQNNHQGPGQFPARHH
jgi:hypothetical protein